MHDISREDYSSMWGDSNGEGHQEGPEDPWQCSVYDLGTGYVGVFTARIN